LVVDGAVKVLGAAGAVGAEGGLGAVGAPVPGATPAVVIFLVGDLVTGVAEFLKFFPAEVPEIATPALFLIFLFDDTGRPDGFFTVVLTTF
jgi:hypothetical protein